jgi:hypothetical protein
MSTPTSPFTSMVITFNTGSDDKDGNTRLEIFIFTPPPGNPAVAYYDDGSNDHIDVATTKSFTVPAVAGGFQLQQLTTKAILIKIAPVGHDTWRFQFSAVLYFADGTQVKVAQTGPIVLDQDANQFIYPLTGATISSSTSV